MLLSLDGRRIYYDLAGPQNAPTICFTHSLNSDGGMWTEQLVPLLAQALHHGTDHRSQICTALTSLGITWGAFVLTYLLAFASWGALALGGLAPWWTKLLTAPEYQRAEKGVALLAFGGAIFAGYTANIIHNCFSLFKQAIKKSTLTHIGPPYNGYCITHNS